MGHGSIYTLSIVSIFHLKDGQNFANFFKSFLAAEFMRHTLIPIIKTGREWTFLIPTRSFQTSPGGQIVVLYATAVILVGFGRFSAIFHEC